MLNCQLAASYGKLDNETSRQNWKFVQKRELKVKFENLFLRAELSSQSAPKAPTFPIYVLKLREWFDFAFEQHLQPEPVL